MSDERRAKLGRIGWMDLTVENASVVRDFYKAVVGWEVEEVPMGDYSDYVMKLAQSGEAIGGICHARGPNTGLPAKWLMYINVDNLELSLEAAKKRGAKLLAPIRVMKGYGRMCIVEDPAGAPVALFEPL